MKPKMLDPWTMSRVQQPARAYEKFYNSTQKPFNYTGPSSDFKPASETEGISQHYKEILATQKRKYGEWVMCPSKFEVEPKEPIALKKQSKIFRAGSTSNKLTFGYSQHTPWEEFQSTISTKNYQTVIRGQKYPKRAEFSDDESWLMASAMAERRGKTQSLTRELVY